MTELKTSKTIKLIQVYPDAEISKEKIVLIRKFWKAMLKLEEKEL